MNGSSGQRMTESLWVGMAVWMLKVVGRAALLTALVGIAAVLLDVGSLSA